LAGKPSIGTETLFRQTRPPLDALYQLYVGLDFPVLLLFDNDIGGDPKDIRLNKVLTRPGNLPESERPAPVVAEQYAILQPDFEGMVRAEVEQIQAGLYDALKAETTAEFGAKTGKLIVVRCCTSAHQAEHRPADRTGHR
jgi:hypothetical protein